MDWHLFATVWIFSGTIVYVLRSVCMWDCYSNEFRRELGDFILFAATIWLWPIALDAIMEFKVLKNKSGFL